MATPKTQKTSKTVEDLVDVLDDLEKLMQDRIYENNTVGIKQGIMCKQHTHAYLYYRSLVWKAQRLAEKLNPKE